MSETEKFEKRREVEANVRSLSQDQRPLAKQIFQELRSSCILDVLEVVCFHLSQSK